jgi:hypothetical protein
MYGAVMNGIYQLDMTTPFSCATANCNWNDEYTTLGFQGSCANVTKEVERRYDNYPANRENVIRYCNITTPNLLKLPTIILPTTQFGTLINISSVSACYDKDQHCTFSRSDLAVISSFAVYRSIPSGNCSGNCPLSNLPPWEVFECSFTAVAYTYRNLTVKNKELSFRQEETETLYYQGRNCTVLSGGCALYTTKDRSKRFEFNDINWIALRDFLENNVFTGGIDYIHKGVPGFSASLISTNISTVVSNVALSMTNRLRSGLHSQTLEGRAFRDEAFVVVQW